MHEAWFYIVWAVGAYLLGAISAGDLVTRAFGVNIRTKGTGNPGTANISRELGLAYGVAVFVLDIVKGAAATLPLYLLDFPMWMGLMAMAAVLAGHIFPVFWRFQGGTGLVVGMGTTVGLLPFGSLIAAPVTALALMRTRNMGYVGALFFLLAIVAGGLVHRDIVGVIAVLLAGTTIWFKARVQYRDK